MRLLHVCYHVICDVAMMQCDCIVYLLLFSPEGLGAVCGCVFLMAMFLFIPIPSFITMATPNNQVCNELKF